MFLCFKNTVKKAKIHVYCKLPSLLDFRWPTETTEPLRKNNKQDSFSLTDFIYPLLAYVSHATTDWETNISQYLL